MENAKTMFEKLGYKLNEKTESIIEYKRTTPTGEVEHIVFKKQGKHKSFSCFINNNYSYCFIHELPAINKQIEELGWNNE